MNRKIITGETGSITALRNLRDVNSDASFGIKGEPNSMMLKELTSGKPIGEYSQAELNTRYGYPNDSLTVKLIDGSSYRDVHKSVKNKGLIETIIYSLNAPDMHTVSDHRLVRTEPLEEMSNEKLMQIAFSPFNYSRYGKEIKSHFSLMNLHPSTDLKMKINKWYDSNTKKDLVIKYIEGELYKAYANKMGVTREITVPPSLLRELSFRKSIINTSEMIAIGGIQYVNLQGYLLYEKWGEKSWNSQGRIVNTPTIIRVKLDFLLGDWFGVDEEDVTNNRLAAQLGRRELAALWVLQHQRGYRPFICFYEYSETKEYKFDITRNM